MHKILITSLILASGLLGWAQDAAYYQTAYNSQGDTLRARLHRIIDNHVEYPYTATTTDVWDILSQTDKDPSDTSCVRLVYSKKSVNAAEEYNSGKGWSREHVWAKSRGDFGTELGAGTDVHHLVPCDISVNSTRNNRNFDDCKNCIDVIDEGIYTGSKIDADLWIFEPPDEVKGDIARMLFYMAIRYEGDSGEPNLELTNTLQDKSSKEPLHGIYSTLLNWHRSDRVSSFERNRNDIIFKYQKNRNPFIDHPELAEFIWGDSIHYTWMPQSEVGTNMIPEEQLVEVYPNPGTNIIHVRCKERINRLELVDTKGTPVLVQRTKKSTNDFSLKYTKSRGTFFVVIYTDSGFMTTKKVLLR